MRLRLLIAALAALALLAPTAALAQEPEQGPTGEPTITTQVVTSFDETPIYSTLFLPAGASAEEPVELILRTHGFGGQGERSVGSGTLAKLLDAGYAVLTWDERGFGYSGGEVHLDSPEFEGRDASALIDWIVANVGEIALEGPGDPLIGWSGGSYAGGIQPATAAFDERVDVLAPEISWSDLSYSLEEGDVINIGWGSLLYSAGKATASSAGLDPRNPAGPQAGGYAQEVDDLFVRGLAANGFTDAQEEFLRASSIAGYGDEHPLAVPTLVMNGSVDTLFDLRDGYGVFDHVRANGAPAKFIAFCGGHVSCPGSYADADDRGHLDDAILTWFARYLRGKDVDTGATVEYRTNEGEWRTADDFTPSDAELVTGSGSGSLVSSPATGDPNEDSTTTAAPSPSGDPRALTIELAAADDGPLELVGFPEATLDVTGTGTEANVFVKLVDREAGEVVNLQENPLHLTGLGETQTVTIPMSGIAYTLTEGHHLDAQVATESLMHFTSRTPASLDVAAAFEVPVRTRLDAPVTEPVPTGTSAPRDPQTADGENEDQARVRRASGADRIATAIAISSRSYENAETVVLARADQFPDALAGGPLAARLDAPLLLTGRDGLDARVADEIERLGATAAVLLGGPSALTPTVEADLARTGVTDVRRHAGSDRYDTARLVAEELGGSAAFLVKGVDADPDRGWEDAVAVSGLAAHRGQPILLTGTASLAEAAERALAGRAEVTIVGGTAAVSEDVATEAAQASGVEPDRLAGATRYGTSLAVNEAALADGLTPATTWLATGLAYPDALTAGPAAATDGGLLLLVDGADLADSEPTRGFLAEHADEIDELVLAGGTEALSARVADQAAALLDG